MKSLLNKLDLKKLWIYVFLLFFISLPLTMISDSVINAALFFGVCLLIIFKINIPKFPLVLFSFALILRIAIIFIIDTPPQSDFYLLLDASQRLIEGDYSFQEMGYFKLWSYQIGFVLYQSIFLRIWNNIIFLKLINCLFASATTVLVYLIAKEFTSEKASRLVSFIYCVLPFPLVYVTVLTNQFPSSFLIYLGIYILISKKIKLNTHIKHLIFALLLVIANILRPESIIPLVSIAIFLILTLNKTNYKQNLINLAIVLVTYFALSKLVSLLFVITNIAPLGLTNNDSLWKFVLGFNHETAGGYSVADEVYLGNAAAELELIKSRIFVSIEELFDLFEAKIQRFWSGTALDWSLGFCASSGLTVFGITFRISDDLPELSGMNKWLMVAMYCLVFFGVFKYIKNKDYNNNVLLLINQVFVTFGVYLLIEVQPRYSYHIQICILILAALGISVLHDNFKSYKEFKNKSKNDPA